MRIVIIFLLKMIAMFFVGIIAFCTIVLALLMWDKKFMEMEDGLSFIFPDLKR